MCVCAGSLTKRNNESTGGFTTLLFKPARPGLIKPIKKLWWETTHFFRYLVIIWWREFDDEPVRWNLYRIESYTRRIQKGKWDRHTHTHNRVIVIARGGTGEIHPFFITRLRNRRSRIVSTNLYCGDIFVETRKRNRQPEIILFNPKTLNWGQKKERHKNEVIISVDLSGTIGQDSRLASRMEPLDQHEGKYSYRMYDTVLNNIAFVTKRYPANCG